MNKGMAMVSEVVSDAICLQYALEWLHLINEQGDGNGKWRSSEVVTPFASNML